MNNKKTSNTKQFGIVSYNIYCNFTNYGSALQSWALFQTVNNLDPDKYRAILVNYCPDILADKNPLDPMKNMWDKDAEARRQCELSLPAIRVNYEKFDRFYHERFRLTSQKYTSANFEDILSKEKLDGFICGSDTIFCLEEFGGYDKGYYADYECMKNKSISYAASFGDSKFTDSTLPDLLAKLKNFKAIGLREKLMVPTLVKNLEVSVKKNVDPTLLLTSEDYDTIAEPRLIKEKYLLLYTRRYNSRMEAYAEKIAKEKGLKIVEISLRATNKDKGHIMRYDAGVEEFLSLVKYAEFVVTNSFHGLIFGVQYRKPLCVFTREQANTKISELLDLFGMPDSCFISGDEQYKPIDYGYVHNRINIARKDSIHYLKEALSFL